MTDATVSEKARAYAASYHVNTGGCGTTCGRIQRRELDDVEEVQAFARFEAEVRREVVEQCAKVAERTHAPFTATAIRAILDGEAG